MMQNNIINQLKSSLSPQLLTKIATAMDEPEAGVGKAFDGMFPSLLAGMLSKGSEAGSADTLGSLMGLLKNAPALDTLTSNPSAILDALGGGKSDLTSMAGKFLPLIFGSKAQGIFDFIAKFAGIKSSSVASLFNIAVPMVMGQLTKALDGKNTAAGLLSYLSSQKGAISKFAPEGLGSLLGVADLSQLGSKVSHLTTAATEAKLTGYTAATGSSLRPLMWLGLLLLLAGGGLLYYWLGTTEAEITALDPIAGTVPPVMHVSSAENTAIELAEVDGSRWVHAGVFLPRELPDKLVLQVPENSLEDRLLLFLDNTSLPIEDAAWLSFDRIIFDTASATLHADSNEQLANIGAILKAYPNVILKIGGYTDSTGDVAGNLQLSQARADSVKTALSSLGVAADRLEAKGYGEEHPVAPNDTEENRAKNRRIDIRVTNK